ALTAEKAWAARKPRQCTRQAGDAVLRPVLPFLQPSLSVPERPSRWAGGKRLSQKCWAALRVVGRRRALTAARGTKKSGMYQSPAALLLRSNATLTVNGLLPLPPHPP